MSGSSAIIRDRGWILPTEIDFSQALAPIHRLSSALVGLTVAVAAGAIRVTGRFARAIVVPLQMASEADRALAKGNDKAQIATEDRLARSFA